MKENSVLSQSLGMGQQTVGETTGNNSTRGETTEDNSTRGETRTDGNSPAGRGLISRSIWQGIRLVAEFTFWLDDVIGRIGARLFGLLPDPLQKALVRGNNKFKRARNLALGVDDLQSIPRAASQLSSRRLQESQCAERNGAQLSDQRGDVPGWVLVVLMTTGLVTALWTIAAPRLSQILRNSLDSMNSIR